MGCSFPIPLNVLKASRSDVASLASRRWLTAYSSGLLASSTSGRSTSAAANQSSNSCDKSCGTEGKRVRTVFFTNGQTRDEFGENARSNIKAPANGAVHNADRKFLTHRVTFNSDGIEALYKRHATSHLSFLITAFYNAHRRRIPIRAIQTVQWSNS